MSRWCGGAARHAAGPACCWQAAWAPRRGAAFPQDNAVAGWTQVPEQAKRSRAMRWLRARPGCGWPAASMGWNRLSGRRMQGLG